MINRQSTRLRSTDAVERNNRVNLRVLGVGTLITTVLLGIAVATVYLPWVHQLLTLRVLGIVAVMMYGLLAVLWHWRKVRQRAGSDARSARTGKVKQ
jgi:hypothetical protein